MVSSELQHLGFNLVTLVQQKGRMLRKERLSSVLDIAVPRGLVVYTVPPVCYKQWPDLLELSLGWARLVLSLLCLLCFAKDQLHVSKM